MNVKLSFRDLSTDTRPTKIKILDALLVNAVVGTLCFAMFNMGKQTERARLA